MLLNNVAGTYTSREQIEVYRFSLPVAVFAPLLAIFLQAFIPRIIPFFSTYFDLPLLVTIFFAMARRNPVTGLLTGAAIGLAQDALGSHPIGLYGIKFTFAESRRACCARRFAWSSASLTPAIRMYSKVSCCFLRAA